MTKKILIADDDAAISDALQMMLEMADYAVSTTDDGAAIYSMKTDLPDLVLMDIWMSGEDGRDLCTYLKNNPDTDKIPVVMISASRDVQESAKSSGADDFIAKPFEMEELLRVVKKYVGE